MPRFLRIFQTKICVLLVLGLMVNNYGYPLKIRKGMLLLNDFNAQHCWHCNMLQPKAQRIIVRRVGYRIEWSTSYPSGALGCRTKMSASIHLNTGLGKISSVECILFFWLCGVNVNQLCGFKCSLQVLRNCVVLKFGIATR